MAPKRKSPSTTRAPVSKKVSRGQTRQRTKQQGAVDEGVRTTNDDKQRLVSDVLQELRPLIKQTVQEAMANNNQPITNVNAERDLDDLFATPDEGRGEMLNPLHLHVPPATRECIKQGRYVSLCDLLCLDDKDISVNISNTGNLTVKNRLKHYKIANCEQWFSAFLIFASIFADCFPDQSSQLFKYMSIVQNLCKTFGVAAGLKYDEDFRKMREISPLIRWDVIHQELYLLAASKSVGTQNGRFRDSRNQLYVPFGFCRQFNTAGACTWANCLYKHQCCKCSGSHGAFTCKSAGSRQNKAHAQNKPPLSASK